MRLPLEHANRNLIFNYKIASVCGIVIGNRKPQLSEIHDYASLS